MCAQFSDDDVGKTVVNAAGEEVGIVSAVEHGTARVNPDPGITDSIKAMLGWEDTAEETYPLQEDAVERVTSDEIRLEGELRGSGHGDTDAGTDHTDTTDPDLETGPDRTGSGRDEPRGTTGTDVGDDDDELIDTDVDDDDDELIDTDVGDDAEGMVDIGDDDDRHTSGTGVGDETNRDTGTTGTDAGGDTGRHDTGTDVGDDRGHRDTETDVGGDMGRHDTGTDVGDDRGHRDTGTDVGDDTGRHDTGTDVGDDDELIDTDVGDDAEGMVDIGDDDDDDEDPDLGSDR